MPERDRITQPLHDILSAFSLLTRLPVPQTARHRPAAVWAWPVVGLAISGLAVSVAMGLVWLGASSGAAAAACLATFAVLTGAMHEDGLADTADGLFGGWTKERRLEIMKDSHIGSYGTLALILVGLFNWSLLSDLIEQRTWGQIMAAGALSRVSMAGLMVVLPHARQNGLSRTVGTPPMASVLVAVAMALGAGFALGLGSAGLALSTAYVTATACVVGLLARQKIGGQTGDILGATQQLSFAAALLALSI